MNHNLKPSSFPPPSSFLAAKQTTYIVHMNHNLKPSSFPSHRHWYSATLNSLTTTSSDSDSDSDSLLLYTYTTAYHGFAASLTPSQAESLLRSDSVLGVYQDTLYSLHTTRTPEFLGLVPQLVLWAGHTPLQLNQASQEVVVGVLDTGVWPESKSFDDSLTPSQAESLRRSDSVLSVYQDTLYSLHTTRTTEFLGLDPQLGLWPSHTSLQLNQASQEVVVGVLDTGVWPESKSFDNSGMLDKWKGECESGPDFKPTLRNKKLIGARRFSSEREFTRLRDYDGHGTHTSSTAAGAHVANASLLGYASGTARGMAINARLAAHKICWKTGCFGSDILAGMDRAILVDVLSLSLGCGSAPSYRDTIAIGAFTATEKGIFVSWSAGNSGPGKGSLANVAPWIMTVGAGTIDRDFPAYAVMGDSKRFTGVSLYSGKGMGKKPVGLVYSTGKNSSSNLCLRGSLEPDVVRGKLVLCDRGINARVEKGLVVRDAGGVGMILENAAASGEELVADSHLLPAVAVGRKVGDLIRDYVRKDEATAVLSFDGKVLNVRPSPVVAAFSSRGPNMVTQQVLKPDVIGPGVNILAGWSEAVGPTGLDQDTRKTQFNIMSGVEIEAEEKKIPANENELTFVPETNSFGQNFRPSEGIGVSGRACCGCRHPCSCNPCYCTVSLSAPRVMPSEGSEKSTEAEREGILPKTRACSFWGFWIWIWDLEF